MAHVQDHGPQKVRKRNSQFGPHPHPRGFKSRILHTGGPRITDLPACSHPASSGVDTDGDHNRSFATRPPSPTAKHGPSWAQATELNSPPSKRVQCRPASAETSERATVVRVDPSSRAMRRFRTGGSPVAMAVGATRSTSPVGRSDPRHTSAEHSPSARSLADLRLHHPERLHAQPQPANAWIEFNTQVPPFDNPVARRAVNYAVNHRQLTDDTYGPGLTEPSCQLLPRNFPGHKPYCPYTRAGPATYNGPDLAKARRLVAQSGTRGARVAVYYEISTPNYRDVLDDLVAALGRIGYRVTAHPVPCRYFGACPPFGPRRNVQIGGPTGFIADYTSPDTFYDNLLSCRVRDEQRSGFCDPHIDRVAALARRTARTDPGAARRLWTRVDRMVTDAAPWIALGSDTAYQFTSARVGNYQQTFYGPIYSQLWVT